MAKQVSGSNKRCMKETDMTSPIMEASYEETESPTRSSKKSAASRPRPHVCLVCTRAFARLEHLKRHQRSHTNEKPFQCAACGRCFARRDLVLRHQQKLHASLPTNNRSNIQRKGKTQRVSETEGEIVPDYLNDNINIVKNNTSAKLPIPERTGSQHSAGAASASARTSAVKHGSSSSNELSSSNPNTSNTQSSISPDYDNHNNTTTNNNTGTNTSNSKHLQASLPNTNSNRGYSTGLFDFNTNFNSPATSVQHQSSPNNLFLHTVPSNSQQTQFPMGVKSIANNALATNDYHHEADYEEAFSDELDSDIDIDSHPIESPQAFYKADNQFSNSSQLNDRDTNLFRDQRHASFSAAASSNYTGFPTAISNVNLADLENDAPQQVRFSSPQLKHTTATGEFGYVDLDLLDDIDFNDLGVDFQTLSNYNPYTNSFNNIPKKSQNEQPITTTTNNNSQIHSKSKVASLFNLSPHSSPGATDPDSPLNKVLSNPNNGSALKRVLSHPNSDVALQRVLSHPQSDLALQKVLSHPQPEVALQRVLSHASDNDWFDDIMNLPIDKSFPAMTDHIGFTDTPTGSENSGIKNGNVISPNHDLNQLFRMRQIDLSKHVPYHYQNPLIPGRCSESVRSHIIEQYNLTQQQFPQLDDLNHYLSLYELEFSTYFPFIHIPSLKIDQNIDQIPLLLSMAAVGALYSFHAKNSSTLFNFSRFLIHNFMEKQMNSSKLYDIPLYISQSLVLHMFLGMFHNDTEISKLISRQLSSLVSLVKNTKLDMPLEVLELPPQINVDLLKCENPNLVLNCYDYFVKAQSRIRTCHVLHFLCTLYGCLTENKIEFSMNDIQCGTPCPEEELWEAKNVNAWMDVLETKSLLVDSKFSLIRLSNGPNYRDLWREMTNLTLDKVVGKRTMLSMLFSMLNYIHVEYMTLENQEDKSDGSKMAEWRFDQRPYIESMIKTWESCFIKNGGLLVPRGQNIHTISRDFVLKLSLPLLSFTKVNKCVYLSPILSKVWNKDFEGMNEQMKNLARDVEALRDAVNYSLDILNLWIEIISITNDAEKTSVRTPIFFLTCLFTSTLLVSEYLFKTEVWAHKFLIESNNNKNLNINSTVNSVTNLATSDRVLWLRAETIFKKIEKNILPSNKNNQSFSEYLRLSAKGALDVDILDDEIAKLALEPGDLTPIAEIIKNGRLSSRCLSLGVRILADAPVWPSALVFAEALKVRAISIYDESKGLTPSPNSL